MLEVKQVTKKYKDLIAVNGVSLKLEPGQTVGLVGESGSGKSTLGRILAGLERPDSGEVLFEGKPITDKDQRKHFRKSVQMIFQNPMNALNPRWTVRSILAEPFIVNGEGEKQSDLERLLDEVRLPKSFLTRRPRELSGGERQRICIARALALKPKLVICDEAVSSLDVLVRAEILNLLLDLQQKHDIGYLFISHDLMVVRHMSEIVAVMRRGVILEHGSAIQVLTQPQETYTREILSASHLDL